MEIKIKGVSNGYVVEYDAENRFGESVTKTAVQIEDEELKKFIGGLIFKEYVSHAQDGQDNLTIKID